MFIVRLVQWRKVDLAEYEECNLQHCPLTRSWRTVQGLRDTSAGGAVDDMVVSAPRRSAGPSAATTNGTGNGGASGGGGNWGGALGARWSPGTGELYNPFGDNPLQRAFAGNYKCGRSCPRLPSPCRRSEHVCSLDHLNCFKGCWAALMIILHTRRFNPWMHQCESATEQSPLHRSGNRAQGGPAARWHAARVLAVAVQHRDAVPVGR